MKSLIKIIANRLGYDIRKKVFPQPQKQTVRTNEVTLYDTVTGKYYLPTEAYTDVIVNDIKANKIFDEHIYEIAKKYIKEDTIVLDIGSNFGQLAILMSKLVGKDGLVYAYEADDFVYENLVKNVEINDAAVSCHFGAVHNKSGETLYFPVQDFERFGTYGSYGIDYVNGKGRPVQTFTVDDFKFDKPISFIKIDIQGGDLFALQGAKETIKKHKMPIIFEYEYAFEDELGLSFQEYVDFVDEIGYKFEKVIMGQNYLILPKNV